MRHRSSLACTVVAVGSTALASPARAELPPFLPTFDSISIPFPGAAAISASPTGLVVSADLASIPNGRVLVFDGPPQGPTWTSTELPVPAPFSGWGSSVGRSGDFIAVGAPYRVVDGKQVGSVSLFDRLGGAWTQTALLVGDAGPGLFGFSVAIDGSFLAVGVPGAVVGGLTNAGSVVLFERTPSGWVETATITSDLPAGYELFGWSVALHGDLLAVGGRGSRRAGPEGSGAAWLFKRGSDGQFHLATVVTSPVAAIGDGLGTSVDAAPGLLAAGAPGADIGGTDRGAVVAAVENGNGTWATTTLAMPAGTNAFGLGKGIVVGPERVVASGTTGVPSTIGFRLIDGTWTPEFVAGLRAPVASFGPRIAGNSGSSCCGNYAIDLLPLDFACLAPPDATDCNGNFLPDECEIADGSASDLNGDGQIDTCPVDRMPITMPDPLFHAIGAPRAHLRAAAPQALVVPILWSWQAWDITLPQHASFEPGSGPAAELPTWCGFAAGASPLAAEAGWFAVGGVTDSTTNHVDLFDVAADGTALPSASFTDATNTYFGWALASTPDTLYAATPADPSGAYPIRRFQRGAKGEWTEQPSLAITAPGPNCGYQLAAHDDLLAVVDLPLPDKVWAGGRVRLLRIEPDGSAVEEASFRVPVQSLPANTYLGSRLGFVGDRLVVTASSDVDSYLRRAWVLRRLADGAWQAEAEIPLSVALGFPDLDIGFGPSTFTIATNGKGVRVYARLANGAWGETLHATTNVYHWWCGYAAVPFDASRILTLAYYSSVDDGELWLLDPVTDCNGNAIDDSDEIAAGLADANRNGIPDECERPGDMDLNGVVDATDLALFLGRWGMGPGWGDLDDDGDVDAADLSILLGDWG